MVVLTCIVDEQVNLRLGVQDPLGAFADRLQRGQVEALDAHLAGVLQRGHGSADLSRGLLRLLDVAARHDHARACIRHISMDHFGTNMADRGGPPLPNQGGGEG